MELLPLRLYGEPGCPHCAAAVGYLAALNLPLQAVAILNDPVVKAGLEKIFEGALQIPVLISMATNEVIVGFKPEEYDRIANYYRAQLSSSIPNQTVAKGDNSGGSKESVEQLASQAQGTA